MPTLIDDLSPVVDDLRASLHADFGIRPYRVYIVRTQWVEEYPVAEGESLVASSTRGEGTVAPKSETEIVPTPRVSELSSLSQMLAAMGRTEDGDLMLTEISLSYTEAQLLPRDVPANEEFFYEIREGSGNRRRFFPSSAPFKDVERGIGWTLRLRKQEGDRSAAGGLV